MSVATIVITATRANAPATTIINRGPTGPAGPSGPAGADSITSATTSDGTADINFNQVGIGTASPAKKLEVNVGGTSSDGILVVGSLNPHIEAKDSTNSVRTTIASEDSLGKVGTISSTDLKIVTGNSERIRVDTSGNVGIGTTSPSQKLDVDGAVKKAVFTVNTLPTATAGTSCYVSDSNHTHHSNVGQVVVSGGSNFVPVYYDGTDWRIG